MHYYNGFYSVGWGMLILWIALIALIVLAVIFLVRGLSSRPPRGQGRPPSEDGALQILRERYARGEISREQFEQMKRDLGAG